MTAFISWPQAQKDIELSGAYTDPCSGLDACLRDARKDLKNNVDATVIRLIGSGIESGKIKIGDEKAVFTGNEFRLVRTVCVKH